MGRRVRGFSFASELLHRRDLLLQPRTVTLKTIVGDAIALPLEPFGEIPIAAEGSLDDAPLQFRPQRSRQHRYLGARRHQRSPSAPRWLPPVAGPLSLFPSRFCAGEVIRRSAAGQPKP